jgi:hypothetical protein
VKPQAKPAQPPQFQHDGIDPRRALLVLGLLSAAAVVPVLVLVASPLLWWITAGVAVAGTAGAVVLRRSGRARATARRLPGVARAGAALRRMPNGRFARSPLGRAMNRALGRPSAGSRAGGLRAGSPAGGRPRGLGARLRAKLPSWAGGTRNRPAAGRPNTAGGPPAGRRPGGRARAAFSRLMPGGRRRAAAAGAPAGRPGGRPAGTAAGGRLGGRTRARAARAWSRITKPFRPTRRTGGRPTRKPSSARPPTGRRTAPGNEKPSASGGKSSTAGPLAGARTRVRKARRLVGRRLSALFGRRRNRKTDPVDDFDKGSTYEIGIEGEVVNGKHTDAELGRIAEQARKDAAKRAKKLAKQRAKQEKQPDPPPEWPNVEPHDGSWPVTEPEDGVAPPTAAPTRELPAERDHAPPPSPPVSPPPHREPRREAPRITSTNTRHGGKKMAVDATKYNDLVTNANSRRQGWQDASDAFRRDANELDEKAKEHDRAAQAFKSTGNLAAAEEREEQARQLRDDANTCRTLASKMQEKANEEAAPAA